MGVVVEAEVTPACLRHRGIELDTVDRYARIEGAVHARDRAAGVSDHEHVARRVAQQWRQHREEVPVLPRQYRTATPHGVVDDTLVQLQDTGAVIPLNHRDVLIWGLGFEEETRGCLDRS